MQVIRILVIFFAMIGLIQSAAWIKYLLLKPECELSAKLELTVSGHVENIEQQLRYYRHRLEWDMPSAGVDTLVITDNGMDDATREICRRFCEENSNVVLNDRDA